MAHYCILMRREGFNPCFNGFMDKEIYGLVYTGDFREVSILVLMDSWIKSKILSDRYDIILRFQSLF